MGGVQVEQVLGRIWFALMGGHRFFSPRLVSWIPAIVAHSLSASYPSLKAEHTSLFMALQHLALYTELSPLLAFDVRSLRHS